MTENEYNRTEISRRSFISRMGAGVLSGAAALYLGGRAEDVFSSNLPRTFSPNTVRLLYNENPLGPSPMAIEAAKNAMLMGNRYPDWVASELISRLAAYHGINTNMLICGAGSSEVIRMVADAFIAKGDEIIVGLPTYVQIETDAQKRGAKVVWVPLTQDFKLDLPAMAAAITERTKVIYLCNPNNPTGTIVSGKSVRDFLKLIPEGVVVSIDEAYHDYVSSPEYESSVEYIKEGKNIITFRTFSKIYGLAGLRIGYGIGKPELIEKLWMYQLVGSPNRIAQAAALASLSDTDYVERSRKANSEAKAYMYDQLSRMGLEYIPSEANFVSIKTKMEGSTLGSLLAVEGVLVRGDFREMTPYIRVTIGTMDETKIFIAALRKVLGIPDVTAVREIMGTSSIVGYTLFQNYPNPFNRETDIRFQIPDPIEINLKVYDTLGQEITTLVQGSRKPGTYSVRFDASRLASGVYLYKLETEKFFETKRMTLIK